MPLNLAGSHQYSFHRSVNKSSNGSASSFKCLITGLAIASLGLVGCGQRQSLNVQAQEPLPLLQTQVLTPEEQIRQDVETLVNLGPRVTGTPVMEQASAYLEQEFRKAGYVTEIQTFAYSKFEDQGSSLTTSGKPITGRALRGTIAGNVTARMVAIPNVGNPADFAEVNVQGAIAIVQRGVIPFTEKAKNAADAGAIGLVIVNSESGDLYGSLTGNSRIPVLGISREAGNPLLEQARQETPTVRLNVNARRRTVTGRNVVAHIEGMTQPQLLVGGHYDSVSGSPGANDNASGTAAVLAIARRLSGTPQAGQVWFVAFDGEEDGLQGSRAFVQEAGSSFISGMKGMMNLDMVGVNDQLKISGTASLTELVQVPNAELSTIGSNQGSDHASFASAGVPILFFHRGLEPNYHKPSDRQIDPKLVNETVETALAATKKILMAP